MGFLILGDVSEIPPPALEVLYGSATAFLSFPCLSLVSKQRLLSDWILLIIDSPCQMVNSGIPNLSFEDVFKILPPTLDVLCGSATVLFSMFEKKVLMPQKAR